MEHGKRFVEEYPEIGELLERIYIKRELDQWYKKNVQKKHRYQVNLMRLRV